MSMYPESEKLLAGEAVRDTVTEFLDWLDSRGLHLAETDEETWSQPRSVPWGGSHDRLALDFLGIDHQALELERRQMLSRAASTSEDRDA